MLRRLWMLGLSSFLMMLCLLPLSVEAFDVPKPQGHIYIQDFANVLNEEQKQELVQLSMDLDDGTTAQLGVLILPTIEDDPIEEFAVKALRSYQLGSEESDNGALIVMTTKPNSSGNRHFYITTGYGLEGALPDGKVGRIIDEYAMPYLADGDADLAILNSYKVIYNEIAKEYDWDGTIPVEEKSEEEVSPVIVFFMIASIVIFLILISKNSGGGGSGGGGGGRRIVKKPRGSVYYPGSFGSGNSGGFGGFGSGGGFGGFRGGGGGSGGGGGAGRSW